MRSSAGPRSYDRRVHTNDERLTITAERVAESDRAAQAAVADLIVDAARRGEALGLRRELTLGEYRASLDRLMAQVANGDAGLFVVRGDDRGGAGAEAGAGPVLGTAQWTRSPYPTRRVLGELDRVVVHPDARGKGMGEALIRAVAIDARAAGIEVLMLEARGNNHGALALYARNGFRRAGLMRGVVAVGPARHDMVLMTKELGRPANVDLLGELPAGDGASLPGGVSQGTDWQRTERLLLTVPSTRDADAYFAIHGDPATNRHNPAGPMVDPKAALAVLEVWNRHWREEGFGYWTVRDPATGRVLGFGGIRPALRDEDFINLYYRFRPEAWGHGYATEVGRAALALAAKVSPGTQVAALIRPRNEPSIRVAERLGMHFVGEVERQLGTYLRYVIVPEA